MNPNLIIIMIIIVVLLLFVVIGTAVWLDVPGGKVVEAEKPTDKPKQVKELRCYTIYDVPLSDELQIFIQKLCEEYGIEYELVLSVMQVESSFNPDACNIETNCVGLMQINTVNLCELLTELRIRGLWEPHDNLRCGIYLLDKALKNADSVEEALMIYNCGLTGARKLWSSGIYSTEYTRKVLTAREELKVRERIYEEVTY